jgi:AcrR family transcriptional regulator
MNPTSRNDSGATPQLRVEGNVEHPRKRQIIRAFRTVLINEGYAAASMRRVADECDMKLGNLQYYYPTRDDLVDAFILHWLNLEQSGRALLLTESNCSVDGIIHWVDNAFTHFTQRNFENTIATAEMIALAHHCERTRAHLNHWYQEELEYYSTMIQAALPESSKRDAERRASSMMALLEGLAIQFSLRTLEKEDQLAIARETLRISVLSLLSTKDS